MSEERASSIQRYTISACIRFSGFCGMGREGGGVFEEVGMGECGLFRATIATVRGGGVVCIDSF